jgi:hypothetical protein
VPFTLGLQGQTDEECSAGSWRLQLAAEMTAAGVLGNK